MGAYRIILDSGAVSALAERNDAVRRYLKSALEKGVEVAIPSVVIAKCTTGTARDASLNVVLKTLDSSIIPVSEDIARAAGALRYHASRLIGDTIDAIVVAVADVEERSVILTGDVDDISTLCAVRRRTRVIAPNGM